VSKVVFLFLVVLGRSNLFEKLVQFSYSFFMISNVLFDIFIYHGATSFARARRRKGGAVAQLLDMAGNGDSSWLDPPDERCQVCH
jgi:hypothetical protein